MLNGAGQQWCCSAFTRRPHTLQVASLRQLMHAGMQVLGELETLHDWGHGTLLTVEQGRCVRPEQVCASLLLLPLWCNVVLNTWHGLHGNQHLQVAEKIVDMDMVGKAYALCARWRGVVLELEERRLAKVNQVRVERAAACAAAGAVRPAPCTQPCGAPHS